MQVVDKNWPPTTERLTPLDLERLQKENEVLKVENAEIKADLKVSKDAIMQLLQKLGVIDKEGNFREKTDFGKLFSTITSYAWMPEKKRGEELAFLEKLAPVIMKYKNL